MGYRELTDGFKFTQNERGLSASRIFLYQTSPTGDNWNDTLPAIGDVLDMAFYGEGFGENLYTTNAIICKNRTAKFVASDIRTVEWTCDYSNEPTDTAQYTTAGSAGQSETSALPTNFDYSGETVLWNPPQDAVGLAASKWVWNGTNDKIIEPIAFIVRSSTLKISGVVLDSDYVAAVDNVKDMIGKVNEASSTTFFKEVGCWMFTGFSTENFNNFVDRKAWKVELSFVYRDADGTKTEGWNKILKKDGTWGIPKNTDTNEYIYLKTSFDSLIR